MYIKKFSTVVRAATIVGEMRYMNGEEVVPAKGWVILYRDKVERQWITYGFTFSQHRRDAIDNIENLSSTGIGWYRRAQRRGEVCCVRCVLQPMHPPMSKRRTFHTFTEGAR